MDSGDGVVELAAGSFGRGGGDLLHGCLEVGDGLPGERVGGARSR
jgi:hypothetical protein